MGNDRRGRGWETMSEMETRETRERLAAAREAALAAGAMLLERHGFHVEHKAENDYVTDMDRASERMIVSALRERFPEDGFLGEEYGASGDRDGVWVIDPIDGTTNFMLRGEVEVGVVYAPALNELYNAVKGGGAFMNGKPIRVSGVGAPRDAVAAMSFAHRHPEAAARIMPRLAALLPQINDYRRMGSAAFDLCCVACGRVDAYFEPKLYLYDIAAGVLIAREAGGVVTGWKGGADCLVSGDVMATNGLLHDFFFERMRLD